MASQQMPWQWPRCHHDDCMGVRLPTTAWCLAHAAEHTPDALDAELARIGAEGTVDARGVMLSDELLARVLAALPRTDDRPTFTTAHFEQASFQGKAGFDDASFQGKAGFDDASFQDAAGFRAASFQGEARFDRASFQGEAGFDRASFQDTAAFDRASFERATQLGPLLARRLVLDGAAFAARVQLDVTAATLCARRARFPAGAHLRLCYATVVLDDADLAAPAILAGVPTPFPQLQAQEQQVAPGWARLPPGSPGQRWRPRLLSVQRADVAGLRLAEVDLRACRFAGAHNLDRLRIEGAPLFARTPGWWRARRKTLAEEQHWRATRPGRWRPGGWYPRACQPPASPRVEAPGVVEPARLAAVYRELRKGREDAKDEPGAADFYYGECEMRRHDPTTPKAERWVGWFLGTRSGQVGLFSPGRCSSLPGQ
jgi:hypothetical protein